MSALTEQVLSIMLELENRITALEAENEAMRALLPPPAIPPVALQERVVTGIELPDERE